MVRDRSVHPKAHHMPSNGQTTMTNLLHTHIYNKQKTIVPTIHHRPKKIRTCITRPLDFLSSFRRNYRPTYYKLLKHTNQNGHMIYQKLHRDFLNFTPSAWKSLHKMF
ncbi:uncharacterized protein LOC123409554 [Hordeum vulgare subsp. vulgare]|uniref:uncharacterized protein LOC123409554 n=1 Tax=Hordeum vulgare subsp. vulgare TaxID=112509 RepID=UPI001D1A4872|nr:uncharacterized protein LOC123409554 [Hordeum vulgare subsp. vulgare]